MNQGESLVPVNWDCRVDLVEKTLNSCAAKHIFKFQLDDDHFFLWSRRMSRGYRLLIAVPEGKRYTYQPFLEADYTLVQKFGPFLQEFFALIMEYLEFAPRPLW